jgi:hypothetical protein
MSFVNWVRDGIGRPRVAVYLKVVAVLMLLGALSHLGSILSLTGTSWSARPLRFQVVDLVLLPINLVVAWGLWRTRFWAVVGWVAVVLLLQVIPILLFSEFFATSPRERTMLYGLLATHAVSLGIFSVLLLGRKGSRPQ